MKFILSTLFLLAATTIIAQGIVRGKITDNLGESIIGATVVLKSDPGTGTVTDFDGNYSLEIKSAEPQVLVYSFVGMESVEETVNPKDGEVILINIDMVPKNFQLEGVVIEAKANREGDYYMEKIKKNSATSIDFISKETIRKIGDSQVSSAIQRVTGVSSVGGFVTVRGLADRYVVTAVNGGRIPTLDPFTNNINLDIFPSGLIDNLVITKTGSPELPGDWTGAYISVETQDYPDNLSVNVKTSVGVNLNASFQTITTSERSSTDWLGWDDGFRDVPDNAPLDPAEFPIFNRGTDPYQQFAFLGIEQELNAYGITAESSIPVGSTLYQIGLYELGYLPPAFIGNEQAVNQAIANYESDFGSPYFLEEFNRELSAIGMAFPNNWEPIEDQGGILFSQSFTIGNQTKLFGKTLGYNFGFRYATSVQADNEAFIGRTSRPANYDGNGSTSVETTANTGFLDVSASSETSNLSALLNLSYKLNSNNSISLMFMPNVTGENQARVGSGLVEDVAELQRRPEQFYEERRQLIYQFASTHYIPGVKGKIDADISYTDGFRNVPNFITELPLFFPVLPDGSSSDIPQLLNTSNPTRRYRTLDDDIFDARLSYSMPIFQENESVATLKVGGAYFENNRESNQQLFRVANTTERPLPNGLDGYLRPEVFNITSESGNNPLYYVNESNVTDNDVGFKKVWAAFAMVDYNVTTRLRTVGGLRVEWTDLLSDIQEFREAGLPENDPGRAVPGRIQLANPSTINEVHFLPSISFIYKLRENEVTPFNLRLNYFRSVARPSFREISFIRLFDYEYQGEVQGNVDLEITTVDNFDVRLENYLEGGNSISISGFYKRFDNHIELIQEGGGRGAFTWVNADESFATGIELEGLWAMTRSLELRANFSYIFSETRITTNDTITGLNNTDVRPMFGQAPWIVNAMLSHNWESFGLVSTVSYNVQGPRLATIVNANVAIPDVYEMPRHLIDIKISKSLGEHFAMDFRVRNLLNSPVRRAYDFDAGFDLLDFDNYAWGTSLILGFSYSL